MINMTWPDGRAGTVSGVSGPLGVASVALILSWGSNALGDEGDYLTEEDLFFDVPVASGASRFPQALNKAPASVIVIDREMIEATGAIEIPDLFRLIPGFQVYSPAYSHPVVNYHTLPVGFPSRMEVNIDGRSVYEPFTNTVFWNTLGLDLEDIDYIEVVRGSNVAADGPNAINGSINIVTKSPLETTGVSFRAEAGSNNTENYSAGFSQTYNDLSYRASVRYRSNDGFEDFEGRPVDDDSETISADLKLIWAPSLDNTFHLQLGYTDSDFTFDQGNSNVDPEDLFPWEVDVAYQNFEWHHQFNDQHAFKLAFFHNRTDITAVESVALLSELIGFPPGFIFPGVEDFEVVLGIEDGYSERYDLELSHTALLSSTFKFDWGADARVDRAKSQLHFSQDESVSEENYRLFGNLEYSPTHWLTLNGGASLGYSETVDEHLSLRLAGNFHLSSNSTLRLAANRARRAPTILDANYYRTIHNGDVVYDLDVIADEDVDVEERDSLELGYYGFFYDGNLTLDVKFFIEENDNLIDTQTDRDYQGPLSVDNEVTFFTNSLSSDDQGFEAYLRWKPQPSWLITAQYTHLSVDAEHVRRINPRRASDRDDAVPEDMTSFLVGYDFGHGFDGSVSYFYQSSVDYKNASLVESIDRVDFNLRKRFTFSGIDARVDLIAQNAFGDDNTEYRYFQQFEPRYYVRLVTQF